MNHWSSRLKRNFEDNDWLTREEAADVITANSGREKRISLDYLVTLSRRGTLHPMHPSYHVSLYQYSEIKDLKIEKLPGRKQFDHVTDNAARQRRYRERHGLTKKRREDPGTSPGPLQKAG